MITIIAMTVIFTMKLFFVCVVLVIDCGRPGTKNVVSTVNGALFGELHFCWVYNCIYTIQLLY